MGDPQRRERAAQGQRQGAKDRHRLQKVVEEQHQHGIDAEDTDRHRQTEALEQFAHALQFALLDALDAGREILQRRQLLSLPLHFADRPAVQFDAERDVTQPVQAIDLRRPAAHAHIGDRRQADGTVAALHTQLGDGIEVVAYRGIHTYTNRDLALRQVELGQCGRVVAVGGDAHGISQGFRGDAERRGARRIGPNLDFRPLQCRAGDDVADALEGAQLGLGSRGRLCQRLGIVAGQCDFELLAVVEAAHRDAGARQGAQQLAHLGFDGGLFERALAARHQFDRQRRARHVGHGAGIHAAAGAGTAHDDEDATDLGYGAK